MEVTLLLCDSAAAADGKLYVLGGGWSQIVDPSRPTSMGLAIKISVPWDQANMPHQLVVRLITADGEPVDPGEGPIQVEGEFETGRPPGLAPGTSLDAVFALNFPALLLPADAYVWELAIDGDVRARVPFRVGPAKRRTSNA